jgi:hypothetical protein
MHRDYLIGLNDAQVEQLEAVNAAGLASLRRYLDEQKALAFAGAGVSVPLYPLWTDLITRLTDVAAARGLEPARAETLRGLANERPDSVAESLRRHLGVVQYTAAIREAFQVQRDPESGLTWTRVQELICRCAFKGVLTTNYDPGIVDARMRVRRAAVGTGFTSYTDELALDRWRTGEVFTDAELPILFVHGHHNQPDAMVLAATDYRRAYAGKLARIIAQFAEIEHLVWIGFSFTDQRINAVLREVAEQSGTRIDPGLPTRHVAIMSWDIDDRRDPWMLRELAEIEYGADLILYPANGNDHSALQRLLVDFVDKRFGPAGDAPLPLIVTGPRVSCKWIPAAEPVAHFIGRKEEMARLDRWATDPGVRLVGVTAWGGAGKTALVTEWLERRSGAECREGIQGLFGWSFYADPSAERWAAELLTWARQELGIRVVGRGRLAEAIVAILKAKPLILVLDGLEVLQEGPDCEGFGRLLDGTLREVLTVACRLEHRGLVVLTSRFPFADLEIFDGGTARMLAVPQFTRDEGSTLLAESGAGWLADHERCDLVADVDGHALAVAALAGILASKPTRDDVAGLRSSLAKEISTDASITVTVSRADLTI